MGVTPIFDFVEGLSQAEVMRCFMPGHKGRVPGGGDHPNLAWYAGDVTEIPGADDLYAAVQDQTAPPGIIARSEENAASLFGATATCYSTQGSTLGIQAMVYLAKQRGTTLLAGRGAHLSFVRACMLVGIDVIWIAPTQMDPAGLLSGITPQMVGEALAQHPEVSAVYLTSPDYLGATLDWAGIAPLCREAGVPLLVDNAHGAYLPWGRESSHHPLSHGVNLCCDSAHKTLPVLTGGGYLHLGEHCPWSKGQVKRAMAMFASTSPSYLILTSLDLCNRYLTERAQQEFAMLFDRVSGMKEQLLRSGVGVLANPDDFAKLTIDTAPIGRTGEEVGDYLRAQGIIPEYVSDRYVVLLLSPAHTNKELSHLTATLLSLSSPHGLPPLREIPQPQNSYALPAVVIPLSQVGGCDTEQIPLDQASGRIAAEFVFHYPPGVALVVPGERIDPAVKKICENTGKRFLDVVK